MKSLIVMLINRYKLIVHIVSKGKSVLFHYKSIFAEKKNCLAAKLSRGSSLKAQGLQDHSGANALQKKKKSFCRC